jgi:hypothetical protein
LREQKSLGSRERERNENCSTNRTMRELALILCILTTPAFGVGKDCVPFPDLSTVEPWDTHGQVFVSPGTASSFWMLPWAAVGSLGN